MRTCASRWVVLLLLICDYEHVISATEDTDALSEQRERVKRCHDTAPRQITPDQLQRLCRYSLVLDAAPAQCASIALGKSLATPSLDTAERIIRLCEQATDIGPALCWLALPSGMQRTASWGDILIPMCQTAVDTRPALCLAEMKRHNQAFSSWKPTQVAVAAAQVCRDFRGSTDAIGDCIKKAPRSLTQPDRVLLCRHAHVHTNEAVNKCAKQLLQRHVPAQIVIPVCGTANEPESQPQECVIAGMSKLRWMEPESVVNLCEGSTTSSAPVECALALRTWFTSESRRQGTGIQQTPAFYDLAALCRQTLDSDVVTGCVRQLPTKTFSIHQVMALCAVRGKPDFVGERAQCVVQARRQLSGAKPDEISPLLLQLCQNAESDAPITCLLAAPSLSQQLTASLRVQLCERAMSTAPQDCFKAIRSSVVSRMSTEDIVRLCAQTNSTAPAECVNQLSSVAPGAFFQTYAAQLCSGAFSTNPALCYLAAPHSLKDHDRVDLCQHAETTIPAACASLSVPRLDTTPSHKARLCSRATSTFPARCANDAPHGMPSVDILTLCQQAQSDIPAQCARGIPSVLRISWRFVALVCAQGVALTPAHCLANRVRQRAPLSLQLLAECRGAVAVPSSLEIARFAYECPQLIANCRIMLQVQVLDQFGHDIPSLQGGFVHVRAESAAQMDALRGFTTIVIQNGSASFENLFFIESGNFTLHISSQDMEEKVARIQIHMDETKHGLERRCDRMFSKFYCNARDDDVSALGNQTATVLLHLNHRDTFNALECEPLWFDELVGLEFLGMTSRSRIYRVHRMVYQLLTGSNIPSAHMSSWECLGIPEGSNRSVVRRAYHQRSLEWHPDKWGAGASSAISSSSRLHEQINAVYTLINEAYHSLHRPHPSENDP